MRNLMWKKIADSDRMAGKQSGFTLVELLVSIAIFSIVSAAIFGFIVVGSRNYTTASTEINLQQEAQLALNQMGDVIIDTTRSVNYYGYPGESSGGVAAVKDAEFSFEPAFKSLLLFNGEEKEEPDGTKTVVPGSGNDKNYQFYWDKADEELYFSEIEVTETDFSSAEKVLLAQHVREFSADLSQVEEKRIVMVTMTFANGNKEYTTTNNITIRNKVLVNDFEVPPIDKKVELKIVPKELLVILEPGETYHFSTPKVSGKNVMDKSVTWSIEPGYVGASFFTDDQNGIIQISNAETIESFQVRVTTNAVDSNGAKASALVTVKIKRANDVNLAKTSEGSTENASEVIPGETFTIAGEATGWYLGTSCDGCSDAVTEDKFVVSDGWEIVSGADFVSIESSDNHEASFKVSDTATEGSEIVIRATSLLSVRKHYASEVKGTITLRVGKKPNSIVYEDGALKYGERTQMTGGLGGNYYIFCARIKEDPNAPVKDDKVIMYSTLGENPWVAPDVFGLELDKTYYISTQIIYPGDFDRSNKDDPVIKDVIDDYLLNVDSSGCYKGKYPATALSGYKLDPPVFTVTYNGKEYKGTPVNIEPIYLLAYPNYISCGFTNVSNAEADILNKNTRLQARYGTGSDPEQWEFLYGWRNGVLEGTQNYGGLYLLESGTYSVSSLQIKFEYNDVWREGTGNAMKLVGQHHYVPYITYKSKEAILSEFIVYYSNYGQDHTEHTYRIDDSIINFEIKLGNLNDILVYASNNEICRGSIYFPVPSDDKFTEYFDRGVAKVSESKTGANNGFNLGLANGNMRSVNFSKMTCEYIAVENKYKIELFYIYRDSTWNRTILVSAGTFVCDADGEEWIRTSGGPFDAQLESGQSIDLKNVSIKNLMIDTSNVKSGDAYIPLPSEAAFKESLGFEPKMTSQQSVEWKSIKFRAQGNNDVEDVSCPVLKCSYNAASDTYTLERYIYDYSSGDRKTVLSGKFTCQSNSTGWTQIQ